AGAAVVAASALAAPEMGRAPAPQPPERPAAAAPQTPRPKPAAPGKPAEEQGRVVVTGSVLTADGKPLTGATLAVVGRSRDNGRGGDLLTEDTRILARGQTGAAGKFRLTATGASSARLHNLYLIARGPGHGVTLAGLNPDSPAAEVTVRLKPE